MLRGTVAPVAGTGGSLGDVGRIAIAYACASALALPASAAPPRPYEGPAEIGEPPADATLEEPHDDADVPADEAAIDDDASDHDAAIDDEDLPPAAIDWRDVPEGETAARRIRGGVLLTAGGLVLVFSSAILGTIDPCRRLAGNGCQKEARTRAALTMGIPGAVILAAGATLLGLGLHQRQRVRSTLGIGASAGRQGAGVTLRGRF